MPITSKDIELKVDEHLRKAGLSHLVDSSGHRIFDSPGGFFTELKLTDASRRADIERAIKELQEGFLRSGVRLEVLVRAVWRLEQLQCVGPSIGKDGGVRAAIRFRSLFTSGAARCEAIVNLTLSALDVLREKLGKGRFVDRFGWSPALGDVDEGYLETVVGSFLQSEPESPGGGYWDPSLQTVRELDATGLSALLGHGTAFRDLRGAIDHVFRSPATPRVISDLASRGINVRHFDAVLPELSSFLGGFLGRGDLFQTSAPDLYDRLRPAEQKLLLYHFQVVSSALANAGQH